MADVTNEQIFELMKRINHQSRELRRDVLDLRSEVNVVRSHVVAVQGDIHNIYGILARHDDRLERIERCLDLRELAEPQSAFEPHP